MGLDNITVGIWPECRAAAHLEGKLGGIRDLLSRPGGDRVAYRKGLGKALQAAYEIHRWSRSSPHWATALEAAYERHGVKVPRRGSNPCTRVVKLCFPGRRAADYHRYAGVLRLVEHEGWWHGSRFEHMLAATPNALAELSRRASRLEGPARDGS